MVPQDCISTKIWETGFTPLAQWQFPTISSICKHSTHHLSLHSSRQHISSRLTSSGWPCFASHVPADDWRHLDLPAHFLSFLLQETWSLLNHHSPPICESSGLRSPLAPHGVYSVLHPFPAIPVSPFLWILSYLQNFSYCLNVTIWLWFPITHYKILNYHSYALAAFHDLILSARPKYFNKIRY